MPLCAEVAKPPYSHMAVHNKTQLSHCRSRARGFGSLTHCIKQSGGNWMLQAYPRDGKELQQPSKAYLPSHMLQLERQHLMGLSTQQLAKQLVALGISPTQGSTKLQLVDVLAPALLKAKSSILKLPLRRVPSNPRASRSYITVPIDIEDVGFVDFLLDSGTCGTMITGELRDQLGISPSDGQVVKGLAGGGLTLAQKVDLPVLRLAGQELMLQEANVTSLGTEYDKANVGGVLGLKFLGMYEVDINEEQRLLALHPPGHIAQGLVDLEGMTQLPCCLLKGGLVGVPASLNGSDPIPAILDISANYTTINWHAAALAGLDRQGLSDNESLQVMTRDASSHVVLRKGGLKVVLGSAELGGCAVPRQPDTVLIRDVPNFARLGYQDQAVMILGRDLLSSTRAVLSLHNHTIWVTAQEEQRDFN